MDGIFFDGRFAAFYERYPMAVVLGYVMAADLLTGLLAAVIERKLSSKVGFNGVLRKIIIIMLIGMCAAIERVQPDVPMVKLAALFFIFNESLSIIENAKRAKVPVPKVITDAFDPKQLSASKDDTHTTLPIKVKDISASIEVDTTAAPAERHSHTDPQVK
jgi:toxin secretion/phage lysis holin